MQHGLPTQGNVALPLRLLYALTALLMYGFGWAGYGVALTIAVLLQRDTVLHLVETWYFDDGVRDPIDPVDAEDAGRGA